MNNVSTLTGIARPTPIYFDLPSNFWVPESRCKSQFLIKKRESYCRGNSEIYGGNSKISVKCRGNVVKIVGENGGNEECAVGEIAIKAWQHCCQQRTV